MILVLLVLLYVSFELILVFLVCIWNKWQIITFYLIISKFYFITFASMYVFPQSSEKTLAFQLVTCFNCIIAANLVWYASLIKEILLRWILINLYWIIVVFCISPIFESIFMGRFNKITFYILIELINFIISNVIHSSLAHCFII